MKLADAILDNIDDIIDARPNKQQLNDLLKDVQSIFEESRGTLRDLEGILGWLDDISSDEKDHVADTKMRRRFKEMGFSTESIDNALKQNSNNFQGSVEIYVPTIGTTYSKSVSSSSSSFFTTLSFKTQCSSNSNFWSATPCHHEDYQS